MTLTDLSTRFLVTGSIGLTGLLRRLNLSPAANDFDTIDIEPLSETGALSFLEERAAGERLILSAACRRRILEKLGVGWPLLLATFLSEVQEHFPDPGPTVKDIDRLSAAQPEDVRLAFDIVRDAFLAHADKNHLHRLAPERRAPVLKLLERFEPFSHRAATEE